MTALEHAAVHQEAGFRALDQGARSGDFAGALARYQSDVLAKGSVNPNLRVPAQTVLGEQRDILRVTVRAAGRPGRR